MRRLAAEDQQSDGGDWNFERNLVPSGNALALMLNKKISSNNELISSTLLLYNSSKVVLSSWHTGAVPCLYSQ